MVSTIQALLLFFNYRSCKDWFVRPSPHHTDIPFHPDIRHLAFIVQRVQRDQQSLQTQEYGMKWFLSSHLIYPSTVRVAGAPQMISQQVSSIFPCSPLPSGTWWTPDLSIPWCCLPISSSCLPSLLPPVTVPCKVVLASPDERETWPYYCRLHLFTMVRRSSCGPIVCWILARTSSLVTWPLYKMHSILR